MFHTHAEHSQLKFFCIAVLAAFKQQTEGQKTLAEFGKHLISSWLRLRAKTYYYRKTRQKHHYHK